MSWLFSRALAEEYSLDTCSGGGPSAQLSMPHTPQAFLSPDRMTAFSRPSQFGMTFEPLTDDLGGDLLTWFLEASLAKRSALRQEGETTPKTCGPRCDESCQRSTLDASLQRTSPKEPLTKQQMTLKRWVTRSGQFPFPRETWVETTFGPGFGYLHTPTCAGNYCAPSMQKHHCARAFRQVFGSVTPESHEYLMGWPIGWTGLKPLVTDKSQSLQPMRGAA